MDRYSRIFKDATSQIGDDIDDGVVGVPMVGIQVVAILLCKDFSPVQVGMLSFNLIHAFSCTGSYIQFLCNMM